MGHVPTARCFPSWTDLWSHIPKAAAARQEQEQQRFDRAPGDHEPFVAATSVVPGLVAPAASPSQFASVYATACICQALSLLGSDEMRMRRALALFTVDPPSTSGQNEVPTVREAAVAAPAVDEDGGEIWAAELDDDDDAYEPIEPGLHLQP